jgi:P27 family predicted phage terminase small subunit
MVAPRWLSSYAREEWDAVCGQLEAMGTVAPCDTTALSCYCEAVARWRKLTEVVTVSPPAFEVNGVLVKNPTYSQMRDAEIAVRLFAREFGLTPSARAGIRVTVNLNTEGAGRLLSH